tara:strand:+ start:471 stop:587 length:117 start_codon:yes stop_codon:yes gene_type:complete
MNHHLASSHKCEYIYKNLDNREIMSSEATGAFKKIEKI